MALAYARMVMANQTFVGITSFGVFPVIASFGTVYISKPIAHPLGPTSDSFLMNPPIDQLVDDVILMDDPNILDSKTISAMFWKPAGQGLVLEWFKNDTYCNGPASYCKRLVLSSTTRTLCTVSLDVTKKRPKYLWGR